MRRVKNDKPITTVKILLAIEPSTVMNTYSMILVPTDKRLEQMISKIIILTIYVEKCLYLNG